MKSEPYKVKVVSDSRRGRFVFRWIDKGGSPRQRISKWDNKKTLRRLAERDAVELEAQLQTDTAEFAVVTWLDFEKAYETRHIDSLAKKSGDSWRTVNVHVKALISPLDLTDVTADEIAKMAATWRRKGLSEKSIETYLNTLSAALSWAEDMGFIDAKPKVRRPKRARGKTKRMRSRPIIGEEFDRMITVAPIVRPKDHTKYERLLHGLFLGGLRIGEALVLSWDFKATFSLDFTGEHPMFRIVSEGQKSQRDQLLPIAPEFAEWLSQVPESERHGRVFGITYRADTAVKHVSKIGSRAKIVVTPDGKTATAHDLRRSFGTRWATRVQPVVLQQLMRHESIETTMQYYVDIRAQDLAAELWKAQKVAQSVARPIHQARSKLSKST